MPGRVFGTHRPALPDPGLAPTYEMYGEVLSQADELTLKACPVPYGIRSRAFGLC
jgi:hypothetical protein